MCRLLADFPVRKFEIPSAVGTADNVSTFADFCWQCANVDAFKVQIISLQKE